MSFVYSAIFVVLEAAAYLGVYHLTQWKLRKVKAKDEAKLTMLTVFNVDGPESNQYVTQDAISLSKHAMNDSNMTPLNGIE